jgi:hypothetical protein
MRLNHYQLLSSGLDGKSAAALADAAAFKRRVASNGDGVLAGLPIACPHLAELFADYQKKTMDKAVKALHDPPPAKSGKPAASPDDDDTDSLRAQLEKAEARAKQLHDRLAATGRKHHGPKDSKDSEPDCPLAPKSLCFAQDSTSILALTPLSSFSCLYLPMSACLYDSSLQRLSRYSRYDATIHKIGIR